MKKILKIGCGCLAALILITVLLIICAESCSGSGSQPERHVENKDEFQFTSAEPAKWERKTMEFSSNDAVDFLRDYCKKNELGEGFDQKKQTFCCITDAEFELHCSSSNKTFIMRHANQIRRVALKVLLDNLYHFAVFLEQKEPVTEKIKNGEKITIAAECSLKKIVFKGKMTASRQKSDNGNIAEELTESFQLFYKGNKLLEYVLDGQRENIFMIPMSVNIRGTLSETDRYSMLQPFLNLLISDGLPVVMEHTAYSWDEKNKRGQVALLLVYKVKPDKKDR